ncbi:hypothetical protein V6C32_10895 [Desulforamulus ruminis]|uniref:hypothetical protein n=1 Tax=Desulforamulus ruminis TaxID=1564 RepID=UPI002FD8E322
MSWIRVTLVFILLFSLASPALANEVGEELGVSVPTPPALERSVLGELPSTVSSDIPVDMALTSVSGIPETMMVQISSGDQVVAVVKGKKLLYAVPFRVEKTQPVALILAGSGMPSNTRFVFEPVQNELIGELNVNIIPADSTLSGAFGVNVIPAESHLSGGFKIMIQNE